MSKQAIPELISPTTQIGQALATETKYRFTLLGDGVDAHQRRLHLSIHRVRCIGKGVEDIASVEAEADTEANNRRRVAH